MAAAVVATTAPASLPPERRAPKRFGWSRCSGVPAAGHARHGLLSRLLLLLAVSVCFLDSTTFAGPRLPPGPSAPPSGIAAGAARAEARRGGGLGQAELYADDEEDEDDEEFEEDSERVEFHFNPKVLGHRMGHLRSICAAINGPDVPRFTIDSYEVPGGHQSTVTLPVLEGETMAREYAGDVVSNGISPSVGSAVQAALDHLFQDEKYGKAAASTRRSPRSADASGDTSSEGAEDPAQAEGSAPEETAAEVGSTEMDDTDTVAFHVNSRVLIGKMGQLRAICAAINEPNRSEFAIDSYEVPGGHQSVISLPVFDGEDTAREYAGDVVSNGIKASVASAVQAALDHLLEDERYGTIAQSTRKPPRSTRSEDAPSDGSEEGAAASEASPAAAEVPAAAWAAARASLGTRHPAIEALDKACRVLGGPDASVALYFTTAEDGGHVSTVTLPAFEGDPSPRVCTSPVMRTGAETAEAVVAAIALRGLQEDPVLGPMLTARSSNSRGTPPAVTNPGWAVTRKTKGSEKAPEILEQLLQEALKSRDAPVSYEISRVGDKVQTTLTLPLLPGEDIPRYYRGELCESATEPRSRISAALLALADLRSEDAFTGAFAGTAALQGMMFDTLEIMFQRPTELLRDAIQKVFPGEFNRRSRRPVIHKKALRRAVRRVTGQEDTTVEFEFRSVVSLPIFPWETDWEQNVFIGDLRPTQSQSLESAGAMALEALKMNTNFEEPQSNMLLPAVQRVTAALQAIYPEARMAVGHKLVEAYVKFQDSAGDLRRLSGESLILKAAKAPPLDQAQEEGSLVPEMADSA